MEHEKFLKDSIVNPLHFSVTAAINEVHTKANQMEMTRFFMQLHLGIPTNGLMLSGIQFLQVYADCNTLNDTGNMQKSSQIHV